MKDKPKSEHNRTTIPETLPSSKFLEEESRVVSVNGQNEKFSIIAWHIRRRRHSDTYAGKREDE